jgi:nucleoside-diphosphate-sugar epimerase
MAMPTHGAGMNNQTIAVVGAAGRLGRLMVDALLTMPNVHVRALVRDPKKFELRHERVEVIAFDAATATDAQRATAVHGTFAVVSTVQGGPEVIIDAQLALLKAAKAAGARRFITSAYAYDFFTLPAGVNVNSDWRRTLAERARGEVNAQFEVVNVLQGIFIDGPVLGFLGLLDPSKRVLRYWGDGAQSIDWTTWEDTARFTAAAAVDHEPVGEKLTVCGDRLSVLQFADAWEAAHGQTLTRERLGSLDDLARETTRVLTEQPQNMYGWLPLMYARGVFGGQAVLGPTMNARYPSIVVQTVPQALARGAA